MEGPKAQTDGILEVLATLRRHRGAAAVDRASGLSSAKVRSRLRGETALTVGELSALLGGLEVDPVEFAAWREAGFHPEAYLRQLAAKRPTQVRHIRDLAAREPARRSTAEEIREQAEGLEVLRLFDVAAAREGALEVLRTAEHRPEVVDRESVCEAWGIVGAIQRSRGRSASAAHGLLKALVVGGAGQVSTVRRTSTLQRVAYLMSYEGNFEQAEGVLEGGRLIGVRALDWRAVGRVLVSLGALLGRVGRLEESIDAHETSLRLLPAAEWHLRFAAYQGLGLSWASRGDLQSALTKLDSALEVLECLESAPPSIKCWVLWLRAEILLARQDLPAAELGFKAVRTIYIAQGMSSIDIAVVSLRLAKVMLLQGEFAELKELAHQMFVLLGRIERESRLVSGAFASFLRLGVRGELTAEFLESLYRRMHGSAKEAPPLLSLTEHSGPTGARVKDRSTPGRSLAGRQDRHKVPERSPVPAGRRDRDKAP